jgi:glycosyltransferase involved in cell wall biosynthesis
MKLKIALLGNMNNNFFALCRYLRDAGYDANLFLLSEFGHFLPSCDTFNEDYKQYVIDTNWHKHYFFDPELKNKIQTALRGYDVIIGCDIAPAYMSLIGRKLDVFIPYGGDIVTFTKTVRLPTIKTLYRLLTMKRPTDPLMKRVKLQRHGIANAGCFIAENAYHTDAVINAHYSGVKRHTFTFPMVYDVFKNVDKAKLQADIAANEDVQRYIAAIKGKKVFFSHIRHCWVLGNSQFQKGNDKIIKAFADYCKQYSDTILVLFQYGVDVDASKKMIDELGIAGHVIWMPLMDRKYILYMLKHADLCIGEIADSFVTYGVVLEAIVTRTPLAHNYQKAANASGYTTMYDGFNVTTEEEIKNVMYKIHDADFDKEKMTSTSYSWYQQQIVDKFLDVFKGFTHKA